MIELTNPYVADNRDYIFTVEGIWTEDSTQYSPPKKVVINFYNGVCTGFRFEGFHEGDIPDVEDYTELIGQINLKIQEIKEQQ
jgi:hypothetical protein